MGRAAWSVRAYHVHGFRNRARKLISNSRCDICEREYSTTTRLQAHLCYSKTCYRKLMAGGHALEFLQPGKNNTREQKAPEFPAPPLPSEGPKEASLCIEDPGEEEYFDQPVLESVLDELLLLPATASMQDCVEAIPRSGMVLDVWRMKRSSTRAGLLIMVWLWRLCSTFIDVAVLHGS